VKVDEAASLLRSSDKPAAKRVAAVRVAAHHPN
jgi:hypothetical protein